MSVASAIRETRKYETNSVIEGCLKSKLRLNLLEKGKELSLGVALQTPSCYEAVVQRWLIDHVILLTKGNPTTEKKIGTYGVHVLARSGFLRTCCTVD